VAPVKGPLAAGEQVLVIDPKGRRYLIRLKDQASFHTHAGILPHDSVIGRMEGSTVEGSTGRSFIVVRPTLADLVVKMPRGAQVIYPKDLGAILLSLDAGPGMVVLESGVGSGALSMALVRAGCCVLGYEIREDFADRARANVGAWLGTELPDDRYRVEIRDLYEGIDERGLDRIVLDLPEPWRAVVHAEEALRPGGIICCYLPTINQTARLRGALERSRFGLEHTFEVFHRSWHIEERSVRPDHRMVAHTGFLTTARLLGDRGLADEPQADEPQVIEPQVIESIMSITDELIDE
jgi:tRNA (adenine57-N1/adenine58-N1)-methyltransferase catalytic subunit